MTFSKIIHRKSRLLKMKRKRWILYLPTGFPRRPQLISKRGKKGISYARLFGPYLSGARKIKLVDPYLRFDYQLQNLVSLCEVISPTEGNVNLEVITSADVREQELDIAAKLTELQQNLVTDRVLLDFKFDRMLHDRWIETDGGWRITLGRGLDIFQKPEGRLTLGFVDQNRRKCKGTSIAFTRLYK